MSTIDIKDYEQKLRVRNTLLDDYDKLTEISRKCFPQQKPWSREQMSSMLNIFPEGQFVVELDGQIIASSSSLIIEFDEYATGHKWDDVTGSGYITTHDPEGDTLYGIEIMVAPEFRGMKLARRLYDRRKKLCRDRNLKRIVIGGRLPNFSKNKSEMDIHEYVDKVMNRDLYDPVLTAQLANGFSLKRLIRDYLPGDTESDGWATLMEWVNLAYVPERYRSHLSTRPVRICIVQYMMRAIRSFDDFKRQCEYFVDVASSYKADFILFPELFTTQLLSCVDAKRPAEAVRELSDYTEPYLDMFGDFAVQYNVNIIAGSHLTVEEDQLFNISYLFQRNGTINKQYKLHITPNERFWWGVRPGKEVKVFQTDCGRINIQICYDVEFPEISRIAIEKGAQMFFVPFCTNERQGYCRVRYCAQARCIENQVYVAMAGTVGNLPMVENMDIQYAQSGIFTPSDIQFVRDGIAAECTPNIETVVVQDVDLELLRRYRMKGTVNTWQDRRKDLYEVKSL